MSSYSLCILQIECKIVIVKNGKFRVKVKINHVYLFLFLVDSFIFVHSFVLCVFKNNKLFSPLNTVLRFLIHKDNMVLEKQEVVYRAGVNEYISENLFNEHLMKNLIVLHKYF